MIGAIIIWSGLIANVPSNWQLCDGTNGTPDLTNRFVYGSANDGHHRVTGGAGTHTHDFTGDGHLHGILGGTFIQTGTGFRANTISTPAVGTTDPKAHYPPYMRLAYIQRMS